MVRPFANASPDTASDRVVERERPKSKMMKQGEQKETVLEWTRAKLYKMIARYLPAAFFANGSYAAANEPWRISPGAISST